MPIYFSSYCLCNQLTFPLQHYIFFPVYCKLYVLKKSINLARQGEKLLMYPQSYPRNDQHFLLIVTFFSYLHSLRCRLIFRYRSIVLGGTDFSCSNSRWKTNSGLQFVSQYSFHLLCSIFQYPQSPHGYKRQQIGSYLRISLANAVHFLLLFSQ